MFGIRIFSDVVYTGDCYCANGSGTLPRRYDRPFGVRGDSEEAVNRHQRAGRRLSQFKVFNLVSQNIREYGLSHVRYSVPEGETPRSWMGDPVV